MSDRIDYAKKLEAQANVWRTQIEHLIAKAENAGVDARAEYMKRIDAIKVQVDDFEQKVEKIKKAQGEAFSELHAGAEKAWENIRDSFAKTLKVISS